MSLVVAHKVMEMEIRKWLRLEAEDSTSTVYESLAFTHKGNESCIVKKAFGGERGWSMDTEDIIPCTEDTRIYFFYEMTQVYHSRILQLHVIQLLCAVGISTFLEEAPSRSNPLPTSVIQNSFSKPTSNSSLIMPVLASPRKDPDSHQDEEALAAAGLMHICL
jgi:hypothetical protein